MGAAADLAGSVSTSALLLDEMFGGVIAAQLRERGLDAIAVVEDPEQVSTPDEELLASAAERQRVLVTANIADFAVIARDWRASGRTHHGIVYVANRTFPQDRAFIGAIVEALAKMHTTNTLPAPGTETFLSRAT